MSNLHNIFLYEYTQEAIDAVKTGEAKISSGGIIRVGSSGKGFRELAKPASMSIADFKSLFEGKEHALQTDEHLLKLDFQLALSAEGLKEIQNTEWLNYAATQRNYMLTYEGFQITINEFNSIKNQLNQLEQYLRKKEADELVEKALTYINYMNSDAGSLKSKKYSPTNGCIGAHLDQISALIKLLLNKLETENYNLFISLNVLIKLLNPFACLIRKFSAAYFYENEGDLLPGNYNEWVNTISEVGNSKRFKELVEYYIKLETEMPYKDKIALSKYISSSPSIMISNIKFDSQYIKNHSQDEYLSIGEQIYDMFVSKKFYIQNNNLIIFLEK